VEDEVLADPDSEEEMAAQRQRYVKRGSPEAKHGRLRPKQTEEQDIVNRQADGSYLLGGSGDGHATLLGRLSVPEAEEKEQKGETRDFCLAV